MSSFKSLPFLAGAATLFATGLLSSGVAHANLILVGGNPPVPVATPAASFTDLGSQGFGAAPRMLTLQTDTFEFGSVTPINVVHDDAIAGANKSTTPTLSTLGWTSGLKVGVGFNSNQSGQTGITLDTLVLTIFDATAAHAALGSFSLASPITFSAADLALQQGNGNSVFNFGLTAAEQTQFNTILAMTGSSGFFAGLSSSLGCGASPPAGCLVSNDGADSFIGFVQVPAPFIGHGLPGVLAVAGVMLFGKLFARNRKRPFFGSALPHAM